MSEVLLCIRYAMAPFNCFLEPVAFMIIISDDDMQLAIQVENTPSRITPVLNDQIFLFRTGQHKDDVLVRPCRG